MMEVTRFIDKCIDRNGNLLISILEDIQEHYRYLPKDALRAVANKTGVPLRDVYGVATFYNAFRLKPCGRHLINTCLGTACHVRGGRRIMEKLETLLGIKAGENSPDGQFTLETVNCLGACALGPVMVIDKKYHGNVTTSTAESILHKYHSKTKETTNEKDNERCGIGATEKTRRR